MAALADRTNELLLSAATIWELAIKFGQGKIALSIPYKQWMIRSIGDLGLTVLPITIEYSDKQSSLPPHHKDPFDRILIAQALVDNLTIVGADVAFDSYGVNRIWQARPKSQDVGQFSPPLPEIRAHGQR